MVAIDKSPSQLGYVTGVKCTQCGTYTPLDVLQKEYGTIFVVGCPKMDGGEFLPVVDLERLSAILDPRKAGRDVARERFERTPSYFGLFPELLPLVWDDGKPRIYVPDFRLSELKHSTAIGQEFGVKQLYFLDDGALPTGSFKHRAVAASTNIAVEGGYDTMHVASTGNLVNASLVIGSSADMYVHALLPQDLSNGKKIKVKEILESIRANGGNADVSYYPFSYDHINHVIARQLIDEHNAERERRGELHTAFSPNGATRTWYGMGEWTAAFQLVTQLYYQHHAEEGKPINIYIGGGSGKLTCMVAEASKILQDLGILRSPIRVWSVQPDVNQPLVECYTNYVLPALQQGKTYDGIKDQIKRVFGKNPLTTIVEEVAIADPGSLLHTMRSLAHPNSAEFSEWQGIRGGAVAVPDTATLDGLIMLATQEGLTPQFVGGLVLQGFIAAIEQNPALRDEIHVVYITGGGKGKMRPTLEDMARTSVWKGGGVTLDVSGREKELLRIAPMF